MQTMFAILHIFGAVVVDVILGTCLYFARVALDRRITKRELAEAALAMGIPFVALEDSGNFPKLVKWSYSKFNSELFRNRLSDLVGFVLVAWGWLGAALQIALLLWVIYETITSSFSYAPYAWFIIAIELFFLLVIIAVSLFCKVLTGRYPGQAHRARAALSKAVDAQPASVNG